MYKIFFYFFQISVSLIILKAQNKIIELCENASNPWSWHLQRLLNLNLGQILSSIKSRSPDSIAVSLRMLEIFTSIETFRKVLCQEKAKTLLSRIYIYLVGKNYFQSLKFLMDEKTPPLLCESIEPPTPLVACLFDLLTRPLQLADIVTSLEFR